MGMLQQRVYPVPIYTIQTSCGSVLIATSAEFQHSVVDYAVDQWQKRLEAGIRPEGAWSLCTLAVTLPV